MNIFGPQQPRTGVLSYLDQLGGVAPTMMDRFKAYGANNADKLMALGGLIGGMSHRPNQAVQQVGRLGLANMQMKQQGNATVAHLKRRGHEDLAQMVEGNPSMAREALRLSYERDKPRETFTQADGAQYGVEGRVNVNELTGKVTPIGSSGTNITVGGNQVAPPKDHRWIYDQFGRIERAEVIPGTQTARDIEAQQSKAGNLGDQKSTAASTVVQDLQRMLDQVPEFAIQQDEDTGYLGRVGGSVSRAALSAIPGTPEFQANRFKESALSNIGIDQLMQMKLNSPTGGALGQVPFQQQQRLEQLLGSLDLTQDTPVLEDNANRIQNIYFDVIHGTRRERLALLKSGDIDQATFDAIESLYKPLSFDAQGKKIDTSKPPADFPEDKRDLWDRLPEQAKLLAWNRYRNRNGY